MYPPNHHQFNDKQKMIAVIKEYPLAIIVSVYNDSSIISHLPLIYNDETGYLVGHIDKNNPHINALQNNEEVTVVFKGPDTYISPSIYTTEQLPTWNYIIVHITGNVTAITKPESAKKTLVNMAAFLEAPDPNYVLEIDHPKMDALINYIHAFEIEITHWEGKFKLSQDKCEEDQLRAKKELLESNRKNIDDFINKIFI